MRRAGPPALLLCMLLPETTHPAINVVAATLHLQELGICNCGSRSSPQQSLPKAWLQVAVVCVAVCHSWVRSADVGDVQ